MDIRITVYSRPWGQELTVNYPMDKALDAIDMLFEISKAPSRVKLVAFAAPQDFFRVLGYFPWLHVRDVVQTLIPKG